MLNLTKNKGKMILKVRRRRKPCFFKINRSQKFIKRCEYGKVKSLYMDHPTAWELRRNFLRANQLDIELLGNFWLNPKSFVSHLDWSEDSAYLMSNSGDYEHLICKLIVIIIDIESFLWYFFQGMWINAVKSLSPL